MHISLLMLVVIRIGMHINWLLIIIPKLSSSKLLEYAILGRKEELSVSNVHIHHCFAIYDFILSHMHRSHVLLLRMWKVIVVCLVSYILEKWDLGMT